MDNQHRVVINPQGEREIHTWKESRRSDGTVLYDDMAILPDKPNRRQKRFIAKGKKS